MDIRNLVRALYIASQFCVPVGVQRSGTLENSRTKFSERYALFANWCVPESHLERWPEEISLQGNSNRSNTFNASTLI